MSRLNIIIASADGGRLYAALETAMASAALGQPARIFLQGEAVALMREPIGFSGDAARKAAGLPDLAAMIDEALTMEVGLFACQSGMALVAIAACELAANVKAAGLVSFLAEVETSDRLLVY